MQRKYRFVTIAGIVSILVIVLYAYNLTAGQPVLGSSSPLENENPDNLEILNEENMFVVPESPLGTFGIVCSCALALGLFAIKKRRK